MKVISNTSKENITYQNHIIPPSGSILLSNDGTVIDEIADNTAAIKETGESLKKDIGALDTELRDVKNNMVKFNYDKTSNTLTIEEVE